MACMYSGPHLSLDIVTGREPTQWDSWTSPVTAWVGTVAMDGWRKSEDAVMARGGLGRGQGRGGGDVTLVSFVLSCDGEEEGEGGGVWIIDEGFGID